MKPIKENDDIKWTFNGKRAVKGTKYAILSNGNKSRLTIRNIRLEDEGTYAVEINNSSSSATLVVNGNFFLKNQNFFAFLVLKFFLNYLKNCLSNSSSSYPT
jgi:hypothetical protein